MGQKNKEETSQIQAACLEVHKTRPDIFTSVTPLLFFGSIRNTLSHIWAVERVWFARIKGLKEVRIKESETICLTQIWTFWEDNHRNEGKWEKIFEDAPISFIFQALQVFLRVIHMHLSF